MGTATNLAIKFSSYCPFHAELQTLKLTAATLIGSLLISIRWTLFSTCN